MGVPKEIIELIFQLLPGFVTAWIFYGLTPYRRPNTFERVVQALIFTVIIQSVVWLLKGGLLLLGKLYSLGQWSAGADLPLSVAIAFLGGLGLSWLANNNHVTAWLWSSRFTSANGYVSEWFATFRIEKRYVILSLRNGRRIWGWPKEWPDHPDEGHFVLLEPAWIGDEVTHDLPEVHKMLISAADVEYVELMNAGGDTMDPTEQQWSKLRGVIADLREWLPWVSSPDEAPSLESDRTRKAAPVEGVAPDPVQPRTTPAGSQHAHGERPQPDSQDGPG